MNAISTGTSDTSFSLAALNEPQARRVRVTCEYIDRLLSDIERIHATPSSHTLFTRYALDLPDPTRGKLGPDRRRNSRGHETRPFLRARAR